MGPGAGRWGSHAKLSSAAMALPKGPETTEELFAWPLENARSLFRPHVEEDEELQVRLHRHLLGGVMVYTDYSGVDCPREGLEVGLLGIKDHLGWMFRASPFTFARSCDVGSLQQSVLRKISETYDNSQACVFGALQDRLPESARVWLQAAEPSDSCPRDEAIAAYEQVLRYLVENRDWLFPLDSTSFCHLHKTSCPVYPLAQQTAVTKDGGKKQKVTSSEAPKREALVVTVDGVTCKGWSSEGKRRTFADKSEMPHSIFVAERIARAEQCAEDINFVECTQFYRADLKLSQPLQDTHDVLVLRWGPELQGWPHKRPRTFAALLNKRTVRWLGPSDWQADFKQRFMRAPALTGESLLVADEEEVFDEYVRMAHVQGSNASRQQLEGMGQDKLLHTILSAGSLNKMKVYESHRDALESIGGVYLYDIEHNFGNGSSAGPCWPCQLTHGRVVLSQRTEPAGAPRVRLATGLEHFSALGFHLFGATTTRYPESKMKPILTGLSRTQQISLAGNGMHLASISAFMYYILANTQRIGDISSGLKHMRCLRSWEEYPAEGDADADAEVEIE